MFTFIKFSHIINKNIFKTMNKKSKYLLKSKRVAEGENAIWKRVVNGLGSATRNIVGVAGNASVIKASCMFVHVFK